MTPLYLYTLCKFNKNIKFFNIFFGIYLNKVVNNDMKEKMNIINISYLSFCTIL